MSQFQLYRDARGEYRWRLITDGGTTIATGGEGYTSKSGAGIAIQAVQEAAPTAPIVDTTEGRAPAEVEAAEARGYHLAVQQLQSALSGHLTGFSDDPCQDRGAIWPCDVATALTAAAAIAAKWTEAAATGSAATTMEPSAAAEHLAQRFHETYERLAPSFGYETREASAKPWAEVPEQNRRLMVAVCAELLSEAGTTPPAQDHGHQILLPTHVRFGGNAP